MLGQVTVNSNGTFTYAPGQNFTGTDFFDFTATDAGGLVSSIAQEVIHAGSQPPLPPPPAARPSVMISAPPTVPVSLLVTLTPTVADTNANAQPYTYTWSEVMAPQGSTAQLSSYSVADPTFTPDVSGYYTFSLVVTDHAGQASIPVNAVIDATALEPATLQGVIDVAPMSAGEPTVTLQVTANDAQDILSAVNALSAQANPVTIDLDLSAGGNGQLGSSTSPVTLSPPTGVTLNVSLGNGDSITAGSSSITATTAGTSGTGTVSENSGQLSLEVDGSYFALPSTTSSISFTGNSLALTTANMPSALTTIIDNGTDSGANNSLSIDGTQQQANVTYTPTGTTGNGGYSGSITVNSLNVQFTNLQPVDIYNFPTATFDLSQAQSSTGILVANVSNFADHTADGGPAPGTQPAVVISPNGGENFEQAAYWNIGTLIIDTSAATTNAVDITGLDGSTSEANIGNVTIVTAGGPGNTVTVDPTGTGINLPGGVLSITAGGAITSNPLVSATVVTAPVTTIAAVADTSFTGLITEFNVGGGGTQFGGSGGMGGQNYGGGFGSGFTPTIATIDWGDGSMSYNVPVVPVDLPLNVAYNTLVGLPTQGSGGTFAVSASHTYSSSDLPTSDITVTVTDGTLSAPLFCIPAIIPSTDLSDPTDLSNLLQSASNTLSVSLPNDGSSVTNFVNAVNGLSPSTPTSMIDVDLNQQTVTDANLTPPPNVTVSFSDGNFTTAPPALTINSGNVVVTNSTFLNATDAPTIVVTGGNLTLSDDTINETTSSAQPAIVVGTSGTLNLGTASVPGGNTFIVQEGAALTLDGFVSVSAGAGTVTPGSSAGSFIYTPPDLVNLDTLTIETTLPDGSIATATVAVQVNPATPTVTVSDPSGVYTDAPFAAVGTATGAAGQAVPGTFTYTYYAGSRATGTGSASAPTALGTYTVLATFSSTDVDYTDAQSAPVTFVISQATPTVLITDGGSYNGNPLAATATVNGAASLEGVGLTLTYYAGSSATGKPLPDAPIHPGMYTVVASFAGSTDYTTASNTTTFTIAQATPTITLTDAGGTYDGRRFAATDTLAGIDGPVTSLEGKQLRLTYYSLAADGSRTLLNGAPRRAGSYEVDALFAASKDYAKTMVTTDFTIKQATSTVMVTDAGGTYNGKPFPARATVTGLSGIAGDSLEKVTPILTYYGGTYSLLNVPTSGGTQTPPTDAGDYTVVAVFGGSRDYAASVALANFTIRQAKPAFSSLRIDAEATSLIVCGTLSLVPAGSMVTIEVDGVSKQATVGRDGSFSVLFSLPAKLKKGSYPIVYSYPGTTDFLAVTATKILTVP